MRVFIISVSLFFILPALADDPTYECKIGQFHVLDDNGALQARDDGYPGETFTVDRKHQAIRGDKINTIYNKEVVSSDPGENGIYSLVNYSRRDDGLIRRLVSLTIQDYGVEKPFILSEGNYIFSGTCR